MKVSTISIDLAKNVFQLMGFTEANKGVFNKRLNRAQLKHFMQMQPPCRVVMEACYSSHYWGRLFESIGHTVHLIPAQHVTPFVRGNKNDSNDTLAIFQASRRPFIRFVPIKTQTQQETLMLHRLRERLLKTRTAVTNQLRSIMYESFMELYDLNSEPNENIDFLLGRGLFDIYLHFLFTCSSIKNKKYIDEKENRLIVISPANFSVNGSQPQDYYSSDYNIDKLDEEIYFEYKVKCRESNGVLVPYIEVPFDISSIEEIIIGPSNSQQEAKIGLDYFCKQHKLEPKITLTKCPFRAL